MNILRKAKQNCDKLVVGVTTDELLRKYKNKNPIIPFEERLDIVKSIKYVDEVIPYETEKDLEDIFQMYNISVRIIGEEYQGKNFTGKEICVKKHIKIVYNKREHRFSTTDLRKRIIDS